MSLEALITVLVSYTVMYSFVTRRYVPSRLHKFLAKGYVAHNPHQLLFKTMFVVLKNSVYLINVFSRGFEGPKRSQFFQQSIKIQQNLSASPPLKYTNTSLYGHLGVQPKFRSLKRP